MDAIRLTLPWPPTANNLYATVRTRSGVERRVLTGEGRNYRRAVHWLARKARTSTILGCVLVEVTAFPPDRRRRDIDNLFKAPLDALKFAGIYIDDSYIDDLHIVRGPVRGEGSIEIEIRPIGPQPLPLPLKIPAPSPLQSEAEYAF